MHGRFDILQEMQDLILSDYEATGTGLTPTVVYLGDFVDRGFQCRELLDHFVRPDSFPFEQVFILGNHDQWLLKFLYGENVAESWLRYGGDATLVSYGVRPVMSANQQERIKSMHSNLLDRFPASHRSFLENLELGFSFGDYFFCHAGVQPDVPLDAQKESDLIWIREPFLSSDAEYGKIIVHGHTVEEAPAVRRNRIGIDTGACYTGNLTCVVLEGDDFRFLSTVPNEAEFDL